MSRLPGDIEGLLRLYSPVWVTHAPGRECSGVVIDLDYMGGEAEVFLDGLEEPRLEWLPLTAVELRLEGPLGGATGRAHAAWLFPLGGTTTAECYACDLAECGADMTPDQIETLRRLVLRLAGREET